MDENEKRISWNFWRAGLGTGWSINYRRFFGFRQLSGNFGPQRFIFVYRTAEQVFEARKERMLRDGYEGNGA